MKNSKKKWKNKANKTLFWKALGYSGRVLQVYLKLEEYGVIQFLADYLSAQ